MHRSCKEKRGIDDARRELAQTEFKFMDVADAECSLRNQYEPELEKLRDEVSSLRESHEIANRAAREVAILRAKCEEQASKLSTNIEAATRQAKTFEERTQALRASLARRRAMLEKTLHFHLSEGQALSDSDIQSLNATMKEIRTTLLEEEEQARKRRCCCVCADAPVDAVLLPCRHQQICFGCASAVSTCPICRSVVESRIQVYN